MPVTTKRINRIQRGVPTKLRELENKFAQELNIFYNRNIAPLETVIPADSIRRKYESSINAKIRKMVEESYNVGTVVVAKEIQRKIDFELFTSKSDIAQIEQTTAELVSRFWNSVGRLVDRKNLDIIKQTKEGNTVIEKLPELSQKAALTAVASGIVIKAFNRGVRTKINVVDSPPSIPIGTGTGTGRDDVFRSEVTVEIRKLGEDLMFMTQEDSKVDPELCAPLNRTVYAKDEPGIPEPPLHAYCRCFLIPLI